MARKDHEEEQEHGKKEAAEPLRHVRGASSDSSAEGRKTLAELEQQFDVHPNQITDWKSQLMERSTSTPV